MYKAKEDKKEKKEYVPPEPTKTALRGDLEIILRNTPYNDIFFLNLVEPERTYEKPRQAKKGDGWIWPYGDRIKQLAHKFVNTNQKLKTLIVTAREDKIFWRGDDFKMFNIIIAETEKMRKMGIRKYRQQSIAELKKLKF